MPEPGKYRSRRSSSSSSSSSRSRHRSRSRDTGRAGKQRYNLDRQASSYRRASPKGRNASPQRDSRSRRDLSPRRGASPRQRTAFRRGSIEKLRDGNVKAEHPKRTRSPSPHSESKGKDNRTAGRVSAAVAASGDRILKDNVDQQEFKVNQSVSPRTLDEELLDAQPTLSFSSEKKSATTLDRYSRENINVLSIHNRKRSKEDEDTRDVVTSKIFNPAEIISIVHSHNTFVRPLFDRDDIKNFKPMSVETQVIRILPSDDDVKKHLKGQPNSSVLVVGKHSYGPKADYRSSKDLQRDGRRRVSDSDLLEEDNFKPPSTVVVSGKMDQDRRKPIQERLGKMDVNYSSQDLRHNLSSTRREHGTEASSAPVVTDYGHGSLSGSKGTRSRSHRSKSTTPDFSRRPDKGKMDLTLIDPTITPRSNRYFDHDDRLSDGLQRSGGFGYRPYRGRGRGRGNYSNRDSRYEDRRLSSDTRNDRYSRSDRDTESDRYRKSDSRSYRSPTSWKHDKFEEMDADADRNAEPSSTTAS